MDIKASGVNGYIPEPASHDYLFFISQNPPVTFIVVEKKHPFLGTCMCVCVCVCVCVFVQRTNSPDTCVCVCVGVCWCVGVFTRF